MPVEVRDKGGKNWKKELTQIRKAARVLRDPGTSSSWWPRSPIVNTGGNAVDHILQLGIRNSSNSSFNMENTGSVKVDSMKEKRNVYLCNWRNKKSESEISMQIGEDDIENGKDEGSYSTREESLETDSLTNVRSRGRNDSKTDGYFSERFTAAIFKCMDSSFTPSIRRTRKMKLSSSNFSSPSLAHRKEKLQMKMLLRRYMRNVVNDSPGVRLGMDDILNLIDQSDDNGDYNSEDLERDSAISHLFSSLKKKGWSFSSTTMMSRGKEDDSVSCSTLAFSSSSYDRYITRNASNVEAWIATTRSLNDGDDEMDDRLDLSGRQVCGIPCYWSRRSTPRSGNGSSYTPSLSDTLSRKGSSFFCGSKTMSRRRHYSVSLGSNKRRLKSKTVGQGLFPLLEKSADDLGGSSMRSKDSDDELSANFSELDLEASSRLFGRRCSSRNRSQEGLELVSPSREVQKEGSTQNIRSLSHKYRPLCFEEVIEQNIVVQSLISAVSRRRIAPVYLFQGPHGVGKTSLARIFASALNCLETEDSKPCGVCRECADFISGKSRFLEGVDGSNNKGVEQLRNILRNISEVHPYALPNYKVIVIDQCQLLPSKTWLTLLRLLDKPLSFIVFILITTEIDNLPQTILSRCQKHIFNKISNNEIVTRLRKISIDENLDVEPNALELIALNADGSLQDAETMLEQLILFGKRISKSLVKELMGVVSEDKLLELLELAMSSNATETVIKSREVMDTGVDPLVLISQLVNLIVDIIAGTCPNVDEMYKKSFLGGRPLTEGELDKLKHALTLLSEAEKHLRVSRERTTWFTAILLQLGSITSPVRTQSTSSRQRTSMVTEEDRVSMPRVATASKQSSGAQSGSSTSFMAADLCNSESKEKLIGMMPKTNKDQFVDGKSLIVSRDDGVRRRTTLACKDSEMLAKIWLLCIQKCHPETLRLLLHSYGKLVSISEMKGGFTAHVAFENSNIKTRAEGFLSSITNSLEVVLRRNVKVKISLLQDSLDPMLINRSPYSSATGVSSDLHSYRDPLKIARVSFEMPQGHQKKGTEFVTGNDSKTYLPTESIVHEQGLEPRCLQASDKKRPGSMSHSRPERNRVFPQDRMDHPNQQEATNSLDVPTLKMKEGNTHQNVVKIDHCPISPSLLHSSTFANSFDQDNMGYESGSAGGGRRCSGMLCWNNRKGKGKKGTSTYKASRGRFSLFGECAKSRTCNRR